MTLTNKNRGLVDGDLEWLRDQQRDTSYWRHLPHISDYEWREQNELNARINRILQALSTGMGEGAPFFVRLAEVVSETAAEGIGFWRSCSGCHETSDGAETGHYPFSRSFGCHLGGGCRECGGVGAIWDTIDYGAMLAEEATTLPEREAAETLELLRAVDLRGRVDDSIAAYIPFRVKHLRLLLSLLESRHGG